MISNLAYGTLCYGIGWNWTDYFDDVSDPQFDEFLFKDPCIGLHFSYGTVRYGTFDTFLLQVFN